MEPIISQHHVQVETRRRPLCSTNEAVCATLQQMKAYIHARLGEQDRAMLEELKQATGRSESDIVRRGL